jgi:NAD(P)-dependent dehydrogenase (short-subunit alcohol dehydrogenase family)
MGALDGEVAVITGGNSGIGLATAKRFVDEGAYVFITGRRQAELDKAVSLIGENVTPVQGDVTNLGDLDRVAAAVRAEKGIVDIIVSNAGLTEQALIDSVTPDHFDRTFNLNARAPVFLVQKLLPLMTGGGSIILVSSAMHVMGIPGHTTYDSQSSSPEERETLVNMYLSMIPIGRLARAEEIASAALFLASDQSSYMTGADLMDDGGVGQSDAREVRLIALEQQARPEVQPKKGD